MFLALRDLRAARGRFALMGATVVLVTVLQVLLNGLATGLVDDGISGLRSLPASHLVLSNGSEAVFSRSVLTEDDVAPAAATVDGTGTPMGVSFFNARSETGETVDLVLVGVDPDGFLSPAADGGTGLTTGEATVVVDERIHEDGVEIGDRLTIVGPADLAVTVTGIGPTGTYGHVPIAYAPLEVWRQAQYGGTERPVISAVAVRDAGTPAPEDGGESQGFEVLTVEDAYEGSPGFVPEQSTLGLIVAFLLVISALVVGAFFTVWTIQRTRDIGVLKALGAPTSYVMRDALGQAVVLLAGAIAVGVGVGWGLGALVEAGPAPFRLELGAVLRGAGMLSLFAIVGAVLALRRITSVDPLIALGADR